jgi:hypothetical protein
MLIFPDIFSGYIQGHRMAVDDNWRDIERFNENEARQFRNLGYMMEGEESMRWRPGRLAWAQANSDFLGQNAMPMVVNRGINELANYGLTAEAATARNPDLGRYFGAGFAAYHMPRFMTDPLFSWRDPPSRQVQPPSGQVQSPSGTGYDWRRAASPTDFLMRPYEPDNARTDLFYEPYSGRRSSGAGSFYRW